jgi:uncharacterized repeat protein (TIGR01451 family)
VDLTVALTDTPDPVRVEDNVTYTVTVTNNGPDDATNVELTVTLPSTVTFVSSAPDDPTCTFDVTVDCNLGTLNNNAKTEVIIVVTTTAKGPLRLTASVSADQPDIDPHNNEVDGITTATFSNLILSRLVAPRAALPQAEIIIDETTKNRGVVTAPESITRVIFSADRRIDDPGDTELYSRSINNSNPLGPGESDPFSKMIKLPDVPLGRYFIIGVADAEKKVTETAESNIRRREILITRPDLVISALRAPNKAAAGSSITVTDTTKNKSPLPTSPVPILDQMTTKFYLSTDAVFDLGDTLLGVRSKIPSLPAKDKSSGPTTVTIPPDKVPGKYFLIAEADADNAVVEADETNNRRARRITITQ